MVALMVLMNLSNGTKREPMVRGLRWREMDSNFRYRGKKAVDFRSIPGIAGYRRALKRYHLMVQPFFCASNHSIEPGGRKRRPKGREEDPC